MKRLSAAAGLALAAALAAAPQVRAQDIDYPQNAAVVRAEARAKAAAGPCERELHAGRSAAACGRYHAAVLEALALENSRLEWCNARMSEASNFRVTASCLAGQADMRIDTLTGLERKVSPKTWHAFDDQMGKFSR